MNQESEKSLQEKKDSIDGCIGHLTIAIQELSDHWEFKWLKHDLQIALNDAKHLKIEVENDG